MEKEKDRTKTVPSVISRRLPLRSLRQQMESLMSDLVSDINERLLVPHLSPPLDMSETDDSVEVRMDISGIKPADVDVRIHENVLTISGKREEEKEEKGRTYHIVERSTGEFSRSVSLPCAVEDSKAEAAYKDGTLTIRVPKAKESKSHRVAVKPG
jgi:HSP20 family protein